MAKNFSSIGGFAVGKKEVLNPSFEPEKHRVYSYD